MSSSLCDGLALLVVRGISKKYSREKEEVEIVDGDRETGMNPIPAESLSVEHRELVNRIISQHTSHRAFKEIYNERVKGMRDDLRSMDESILPALSDSSTPVVIQSSEYTITLRDKGGPAATAQRAPALTKKVSTQLLKDAISESLRDMHIDGARPYDFRLAAQIMSHVQFRPLIRHYYAKNVAAWRESAAPAAPAAPASSRSVLAKISVRKN